MLIEAEKTEFREEEQLITLMAAYQLKLWQSVDEKP